MTLYIHVGKGKTATTFLQNKIFNDHKDINYIAKDKNNYPEWLIQWHYADDFHYNNIKDTIRNKLYDNLQKDKINVISSEAFSIVGDLYKQVNRIKDIYPEAKIILTLRDPIDAILSFYKYNIKEEGFTSSLENCIDWKRTPMVFYKRKPIYIADFYYNEIINLYIKFFGKENLLILQYEDLMNNNKKFFLNLSKYLNVDINATNLKNHLQRKLNKSPLNKDIDKLRIENIQNKIYTDFKTFEGEIIPKDNTQIMDQELKNKIIEAVKGKCYNYYN